MNLLLQTAY